MTNVIRKSSFEFDSSFIIRASSFRPSMDARNPLQLRQVRGPRPVKKHRRRRRLVIRIRPRPRRPAVLRPVQRHLGINSLAHVDAMAVVLRRRQHHFVAMHVTRIDIDRRCTFAIGIPVPFPAASENCRASSVSAIFVSNLHFARCSGLNKGSNRTHCRSSPAPISS